MTDIVIVAAVRTAIGKFGGALASNPDALYFTAGINDEKGGLFGALQAVRVNAD